MENQGVDSAAINPTEKAGNLPLSTKSESNKRYFKREIADGKNNKISTSQDNKTKTISRED